MEQLERYGQKDKDEMATEISTAVPDRGSAVPDDINGVSNKSAIYPISTVRLSFLVCWDY